MWYNTLMWIEILKPLLLLTSVSTFFALLIGNNVYNMINVFVLTTIIQIILDRVYKQYLILQSEKIKNERIKEFSKQGMEVVCPCYLEKRMFIPITLNDVNSFKCLECQKECLVQLEAKTFNKTEIIDLDQADAAFLEIYKKIQEKE